MQSDFQKRAEDLYQAGVADGFRSGFVDVIKQALEEAAMSAAEPNLRHTLRTVEMSAERIRLTLINQLEEPARSAFWEAVRIRDLIRASLSETFATAALSTDAEPVKTAPAVAVKATPEALEQFTAYFVKNYPGPDTIIFDPKWHAPKIFRAAVAALSAQVQDVAVPEGTDDEQ